MGAISFKRAESRSSVFSDVQQVNLKIYYFRKQYIGTFFFSLNCSVYSETSINASDLKFDSTISHKICRSLVPVASL